MIFLKLYRFFVGKIRVSAEGIFPERILNLCAHNGITVWAIRKRGDKILYYMSARDFFYLRKIIRGTGIRLHILKKRGWPFIFRKYSHRYGVFAGIVFFLVTLQVLSMFVWNINVSGNDRVSEKEIADACRELGIYEGVRASSLDTQKLRLELINKIDGLAWAAINIEGSTLTVDVTEAEGRQENNTDPCNLTASANGTIRKIEVTDGKQLVKVGDFVAEGELLVSGVYEYKDGSTALVHSAGKIIAEVSDSFSATVPLSQEINVLSEETHRCYTLSFFGLKIPLYLGDYSEGYLRNDETVKIENGDSYLPIYMHRSEFKKSRRELIALTPERAAEIAKEELDGKIKDMEVISINEKITENTDSVTVVYDVVFLQDIAKEEILLFNTTN